MWNKFKKNECPTHFDHSDSYLFLRYLFCCLSLAPISINGNKVRKMKLSTCTLMKCPRSTYYYHDSTRHYIFVPVYSTEAGMLSFRMKEFNNLLIYKVRSLSNQLTNLPFKPNESWWLLTGR